MCISNGKDVRNLINLLVSSVRCGNHVRTYWTCHIYSALHGMISSLLSTKLMSCLISNFFQKDYANCYKSNCGLVW